MLRIARVLAVVVVAAALIVLAAVMQAKLAQRRAEVVMQELKVMRAGETDYRILKELLRRTGKDGNSCSTADRCSAYFAYNNALMQRLHLAPGLWFSAYLTVKNGHVDDIQTDEILLVRGARAEEQRRFVVTIWENPRFDATNWAVCVPRLKRNGLGTPAEAEVRLNSACSEELRTAAYSFDLRCLSKIGGCADVRELNPSLWSSETARR